MYAALIGTPDYDDNAASGIIRHTFATHLLNADVSLEVLKELMGHHSISLTLRYAQLYDTTKKHQYETAMAKIAQQQAVSGR